MKIKELIIIGVFFYVMLAVYMHLRLDELEEALNLLKIDVQELMYEEN